MEFESLIHLGINMRHGICKGSVGDAAKWSWRSSRLLVWVCACVIVGLLPGYVGHARENPLGNVQPPPPPPPPKSPEEQKPVIEGAGNVAAQAPSHHDARLRIDVNLVQVPLT